MRFRRKPIEVEAIHFDGTMTGCQRALDFLGRKVASMDVAANILGEISHTICLATNDDEEPLSTMWAMPGDWIIKEGDKFIPCRPDVFDRTYEACE